TRLVPHFGENVEDLPQTLYEVAPTVLFTVPRYLQKLASQVLVAIGNATPVKRAAYEVAISIGRRYARARWKGRAGFSPAYALARHAVFKPLLEKLGLDQAKLVISGGAPLPAGTMALWQIWGVNVVEMYGQTEEAGAFVYREPSPREPLRRRSHGGGPRAQIPRGADRDRLRRGGRLGAQP